jgi:uncharacterized membrane protein
MLIIWKVVSMSIIMLFVRTLVGEFVDRIFPIELEIKDTKDTDRSKPP